MLGRMPRCCQGGADGHRQAGTVCAGEELLGAGLPEELPCRPDGDSCWGNASEPTSSSPRSRPAGPIQTAVAVRMVLAIRYSAPRQLAGLGKLFHHCRAERWQVGG